MSFLIRNQDQILWQFELKLPNICKNFCDTKHSMDSFNFLSLFFCWYLKSNYYLGETLGDSFTNYIQSRLHVIVSLEMPKNGSVACRAPLTLMNFYRIAGKHQIATPRICLSFFNVKLKVSSHVRFETQKNVCPRIFGMFW